MIIATRNFIMPLVTIKKLYYDIKIVLPQDRALKFDLGLLSYVILSRDLTVVDLLLGTSTINSITESLPLE